MILRVFAIYDSKAEGYPQPLFFHTKGQALRSWIDAVNDEKSPYYKHPEDYTLFEIASYDDSTGRFENNHVVTPLGTALELKSSGAEHAEP